MEPVEGTGRHASRVAPDRLRAGVRGGVCVGFEPRQVSGLESDPDPWFGHITPATGTGGFAGWSGSARILHDDQGAYFEIELA